MKKEYYISRMRMNARIADTVIDGKHIRIDHGFGYVSLYAHLND